MRLCQPPVTGVRPSIPCLQVRRVSFERLEGVSGPFIVVFVKPGVWVILLHSDDAGDGLLMYYFAVFYLFL